MHTYNPMLRNMSADELENHLYATGQLEGNPLLATAVEHLEDIDTLQLELNEYQNNLGDAEDKLSTAEEKLESIENQFETSKELLKESRSVIVRVREDGYEDDDDELLVEEIDEFLAKA